MDKQYSVEEIEELLSAHVNECGVWGSLHGHANPPHEEVRYSRGAVVSVNGRRTSTTRFIADAPAIIKQFLARVKEAEAVEEMLKRYALENSADGRLGETIYYDENKSQWCVQGFTDSHHDRLYLALQSSLIKE